ncbi:UNVERIFIED_CONTAM: C-terminal binding protein AN [Sesamum calycinum]|uniref:C-terminal binding protein AN n=1 Tax=Sesamum calycinum TaxID=2727403 RepID=A0AAW2NV63_9LAMI
MSAWIRLVLDHLLLVESLQINRRMEFVFASHSFDVWESWTFEGPLEDCRLVNCRNPLAVLDVRIEILAALGEDGITRWLD